MDNSAARWDAEAKYFQNTFKLGQNDYNKALFDFWTEHGMLRPGYRVLDIGCGVGKYGVMFADYGCDVTLTDISPKMIAHARDNMSRFSTPWNAEVCDFTAESDSDLFKDSFDFSISTMSPAVCDAKTIKRMSNITRGYCFLTRFYSWRQPGRDKVMQSVGIQPSSLVSGLKEDCESLYEAVRYAGYTPELMLVDYNWCDNRSPEDMTEYMLRSYKESLKNTSRNTLYENIKALCSENGFFRDEVNTKVAWIFWKTRAQL